MLQTYSIMAKMEHYSLDAYRYFRDAPNHERHALVKDIKNVSMDLLTKFIECIKYPKKATRLKEADIIHEKLRYMWSLYYKLGYFGTKGKTETERRKINDHRFKVINQDLDELGRMIGGWIRDVKMKDDKYLKTHPNETTNDNDVNMDAMIENLLKEV